MTLPTLMRDKILQAIYDAIDVVNQQRIDAAPIKKAPDTVLFGSSSDLDSLGLVNLIVATEERIQDVFDRAITLADERALSQEQSPFRNVGTLTAYIELILKEKAP